jgi:eukaryotic-like serine/threonine-protein kinase
LTFARDVSLEELKSNEKYYRTFRPIGAMSHCAPEKWMSPHDARPKSDLFSLGVMVYRNMTGESPFWGDSYIELFEKIKNGRHVPAIERNPEISPALNALIEDLIEPDILFRMRSAETLRSRCAQLLANAK